MRASPGHLQELCRTLSSLQGLLPPLRSLLHTKRPRPVFSNCKIHLFFFKQNPTLPINTNLKKKKKTYWIILLSVHTNTSNSFFNAGFIHWWNASHLLWNFFSLTIVLWNYPNTKSWQNYTMNSCVPYLDATISSFPQLLFHKSIYPSFHPLVHPILWCISK